VSTVRKRTKKVYIFSFPSSTHFGQFGIVLLLDAAHSAAILEQGLGAEDVVLDLSLGVGVVEIDKDRLVLGEEVKNLIH